MDIANMTRAEAKAYAATLAKTKAREYGIPFRQAFDGVLDAHPDLKQAAYGGTRKHAAPTTDERDQARGAARHIDQQAASFLRQARKSGKALTYSAAIKAAVAQNATLSARAGVHKGLLPGHEPDDVRHYALVSGARKQGITIRRVSVKRPDR